MLRRAVELGVDHIDTAQFYGPDVANALIREALHPYADDLALVSKVGARRDAERRLDVAQRPQQLREDVEANLRALGTDQLAAVNLRRMDARGTAGWTTGRPARGPAGRDGRAARRGQDRRESASHRDARRRSTRPSSWPASCASRTPSASWTRATPPVLERCAAAGVAYVPYFPLGSAFAHIASVTEHPPVVALAAERGVTPAQVGLAWLLARSPNMLLIPGTSSRPHLEENTAAGSVVLEADDLERLKVGSTPADRPA